MKTVFTLVLRSLFGLLFVVTSLGKLLDNRGFADVLSHYRLFPGVLLLPLSLSISLGELYLGFLLIRGRKLFLSALATLLINSGYLCLAVITLTRKIPLANCGCFGVFLARPLTINTVVEDGVLVAFSLCFFLLNKNDFQRNRQ